VLRLGPDVGVETWRQRRPRRLLTLVGEEVADVARVPLPAGHHSVNPYLVVADAARLIDFLIGVFGAVEQRRELRDDGAIEHADVLIGDSVVMLSEASPAYPARPCVHFVYVDDVDLTHHRAVEQGARSILAPTDQRWGDRVGGVVDPFDNRWWIATHQRELN
jgi:PhnB protein